jgi:hypothetical protein
MHLLDGSLLDIGFPIFSCRTQAKNTTYGQKNNAGNGSKATGATGYPYADHNREQDSTRNYTRHTPGKGRGKYHDGGFVETVERRRVGQSPFQRAVAFRDEDNLEKGQIV